MAMNFTSRILNQSTIYYGQSKGLKVANLPRSPKAKKDGKFSTRDWVLRSFYSAPKITNKISPPLSEHALDSVKIQSPKRASAAPTTQQSGTKAAEFRKSHERKHVPTYEGTPAVFFEQSRIDGVAKSEEFKFSLVGKFPRRRPSLELIRAWVGREWKLKGLWSITLLDSKHVLLRLDNEADMVYVWLRNRWFINGHLMRVFKWTPSFRTSDAEEPSLAAVWISLPLLPVAFFQQDLLYSIASLVGEVLCADGPTKNLSRTNVARVCVEVDLLEELPHRVYIGVGEAGFWQDINYEKLPFYCAGCRSFGHSTDICKFNKIGVEVDKSQENVRSHLEKPPEETKKQDGLQEFISRKNSYETCPVFRCKDVKSKLIARSSSQLAIKKCTIGESSKTRSWIEVVPSVVTQNFSSNWLDRMPCSSGLATKDTRTQGIDTLTRTYVLDRIENCQVCVSHHLDLKSKTVVEEEDTAKDDDHNDDNGVSGFNERKEYQRYQQDGQRQALGAADINSYLKSYLNQSPSSRKKFAFFWKRKPKEVEVPEYTHWGPLKKYSLKELRIATDGFCDINILGRGGFGEVYKGRLPDGSLVAVKRLREQRTPGRELQFLTEVEICSKLVHKNLLELRGVCMTRTERILVYPYMANGSVASWLRGRPPNAPPLNWRVREQIAIGSAKGLAYLHDCCVPKIIHRDVKAANILLNENFEALVGDFDLVKFIDIDNSHVTSIIVGTFGYMAPEYLLTGKISEKTDVFGYGVMLLELISGKRACDLTSLANDEAVMLFDWAKGLLREKKLDMLVDPDLQSNYVEAEVEQLIQVALLCTQNSPRYRPKMSEVVRMLEGNGLAERWEELQDVNDANSDWLVDYTSARQDVNDGNSDSPVDSTSALHPEELSSPR